MFERQSYLVSDLARRLNGAATLEDFWALCLDELAQRDVTSICYGALASKRDVEARGLTKALMVKTNHPHAWIEAFGTDRFLDEDSTALKCMADSRPIFWDVDKAMRHPSRRVRERAKIERDVGLDVGVSLPASHFSTGAVGGVGLAVDVPRRQFRAYWKSRKHDIIAICTILDTVMRRQHMKELIGLTKREGDCLCWLAAGLRTDQIANRLGITTKVVEKYVFSAKSKLKAATRDQAVAKALLFGIIEP